MTGSAFDDDTHHQARAGRAVRHGYWGAAAPGSDCRSLGQPVRDLILAIDLFPFQISMYVLPKVFRSKVVIRIFREQQRLRSGLSLN